MSIESVYKQATGYKPYPYQSLLAESQLIPQVLSVPTGVGKTAAAVLAWLYRRRYADNAVRLATPRRLVYCLPMRTLVEQTRDAVALWLSNLQISMTDTAGVGLHLLMGSEDDGHWYERPERDVILIGTQDMLLSRALNRGYGMSRYRWPMEFGLLNNDCLWVMDETQLMGNGLATTVQLDCFGSIWQREKACQFLWMSATIGEQLFNTTDRQENDIEVVSPPCELLQADRANQFVDLRLNAAKQVDISKSISAARIVSEHQEGRITLAILNTVPAARQICQEIELKINRDKRFKNSAKPEVCLLHGRFRLGDRQRTLQRIHAFLKTVDSQTGCSSDSRGLFVVSTQVVEAGFDISSVRLWSEIAPWASVVQRLGRLNREGKQPNAIATFWMPKDDKDRENHKDSPNAKRVGPYEKVSLATSKKLLEKLTLEFEKTKSFRRALETVSGLKEAKQAVESTAEVVIRPRDFLELFSTEADLDGGFTDVSHFVRSSDRNADVQVFWRDLLRRSPEAEVGQPAREELCSVPVFELRKFVAGKARVFEWNPETRQWQSRRTSEIQAGMTLLIPTDCGGYSDSLGWTGVATDRPSELPVVTPPADAFDADALSSAMSWLPLKDHLEDVKAEAEFLTENLLDNEAIRRAIIFAGQSHDVGKTLDRWQQAALRTTSTARDKLQLALGDPQFADHHSLLMKLKANWEPPNTKTLWAKFPNIRYAILNSGLDQQL